MTGKFLRGLLPCVLAVIALAQMPLPKDGVDLTRLPLGDARKSDAPKAGYIWPCRIEEGAGGAFRDGPWIHGDTYDLIAKAVVSGEESWPYHFVVSREGNQRVFSTNDLPNHATGKFPIDPADPAYEYDRNPNAIAEQSMKIALPANPSKAAQPTCAPGAVGILLTGSVLFNALDAPGRDAVAHETQDSCQGHPQRSGVYHYHSLSSCWRDDPDASGHSKLAGYALDGFGIYGRRGEGGKLLKSSDLDECHGHTHRISWDGKPVVMYHYHATWDFPYTVGCMRGSYSREHVRTISGPPPGDGPESGPPGRPGGHPDLAGVAAKLGISEQKLREALGPPPPDLEAAARRLGISVEKLRAALPPPP